jgi:hypothetical protein
VSFAEIAVITVSSSFVPTYIVGFEPQTQSIEDRVKVMMKSHYITQAVDF